MKKFNNKLAIIALISTTSIGVGTTYAAEEKLTSAMGYPYKLLIARSDSVKIIYSEDIDNINCKVKVGWKEQEEQSQYKQVSKKKFIEKPLASCLSRQKAKAILAMTFQ